MIIGDEKLDRRELRDRPTSAATGRLDWFCNQNGCPAMGEKNFV